MLVRQKQSEGLQPAVSPQAESHAHPVPEMAWPKAGVRRLVTTGAVQTIADATPMRRSMRRLEIPSPASRSSGSGSCGMAAFLTLAVGNSFAAGAPARIVQPRRLPPPVADAAR
jgi:hypothetical protein